VSKELSGPFMVEEKQRGRGLGGVKDVRLSLPILVALDRLPETFQISQVTDLLPGWGRDKVRGQLYTLREAGFLSLRGKSWVKAERHFWYWLSKLEERVRGDG